MLRLLGIALVLCMIPFLAAGPSHNQPGPATERVFFTAFDVDRAPLDIQSGAMDMYLFSLKTAAAKELAGTEGIRIFEAPATSVSLILNPAPAPVGQLNPFAVQEIRQAMQYLVNREFIANDIYRGMAVPMHTHVSPMDYDFLTIYEIVRSADIGYDPDFARQIIREQMEVAGATLVDGVWNYNDKPIRLKFITRVEDERREVGDLIRVELRQAGFHVDPVYQAFAPAVLTVYSTDPASLEWHLYTEGWGRGSPERYDFANINQMAAPWLGNMPGWGEAGFWQYQEEELDLLGKRLFTGDFTSVDERNQLYQQITKKALDESVRIWLVTVVNNFPARDDLEGISIDIVSGPRSPWTLREIFDPDAEEITVGHLWVWTERTTWNPIGGMGDVYSVDIWRNLSDPPVWNHPFTGIPEPFRATFEVETAGPTDKLTVPSDAVMWNSGVDRWQTVGAGAEATSRVIFDYSKYFQSTWHHGQPITMADVLYSVAQSYEMAYDKEKSRIETALGVTARPFLSTFRGYRLLDEQKLEVYVDFWHFEENYIASYASPSGLSMPWEILAAMDTLVFDQRKAAYSDTTAYRYGVPWISLVMDRDARLLRRVYLEFIEEKKVPSGFFELGDRSLVTSSDAISRYQATLDWFDQYGHLVIANGPFYLFSYDPPAQFAELRAFRENNYPFRPGDWLFGLPEKLAIERVVPSELVIGEAMDVPVTVDGDGVLELSYFLFNPALGTILRSGKAIPKEGDSSNFIVPLDADMTGTLNPGLYQLFLLASSDGLSMVSERRVDLQATLEASQLEDDRADENSEVTESPSQATGGGFGCGASRSTDPSLDLSAVMFVAGVLALARRKRW